MKAYKRRAAGKPDFWKIAKWIDSIYCWMDGNRQFDTREEAVKSATTPGKYRLSFIADGKQREDLEVFNV
jgi:hypothetical protein